MASLSRARGNLEIICSCDDYKSGTIKLASGTGLTAKEQRVVQSAEELEARIAALEAAAAAAGGPLVGMGEPAAEKRKPAGELTGVARKMWLEDNESFIKRQKLPSWGRPMIERGENGKVAANGKPHAGHTKQAERLHEVAVTVGKLDALIPPVSSERAVELYGEPDKMRDVLLEARSAIDEGLSVILSQSHWVCLLNSKGFEKASAIVGEDLGLPEEQAKRARKLDESEALAKCKRVENKPNKASRSKSRKSWGYPHQSGGQSVQPHMAPGVPQFQAGFQGYQHPNPGRGGQGRR